MFFYSFNLNLNLKFVLNYKIIFVINDFKKNNIVVHALNVITFHLLIIDK